MTIYKQDNITVRTSIQEDADFIGENMRDADKREIWNSHHHRPKEAMRLSLKESFYCFTVLNNDVPTVMFGVVPHSLMGDKGNIWLLGTDGIDKIKRRFARNSKYFINFMQKSFPHLSNYVSVENKKSISWLKMCGARFEEPKPFGMEQKLFQRFSFQKD